jgi:hypothetical protein
MAELSGFRKAVLMLRISDNAASPPSCAGPGGDAHFPAEDQAVRAILLTLGLAGFLMPALLRGTAVL